MSPPQQSSISLQVNGIKQTLTADTRVSLLDALRDHFGLTGTKKGCNQGACGACTVLADGERINSCLTLAVQYEGRKEAADGSVIGSVLPRPRQAVSVTVGGIPAEVGYAGGAPGLVAGVLQMNVLLPQNLPSGNQPVVMKIGDVVSQSGLTVAVR